MPPLMLLIAPLAYADGLPAASQDGAPLDAGIPLHQAPSGQWYQEDVPVWRTGSLIVSLEEGEDPEWLSALPGVASVDHLPGLHATFKLLMDPGADEVMLAVSLQGAPGLRYAHPNLAVELHPTALPDDPLLADQWHIENSGQRSETAWPGADANVVPAWETTWGEGQLIAILDSGVDTAHPDLDTVPGFTPSAGEDENPDLDYSGHAHGTACAGLAAGTGDNGIGVAGVAPAAQVMGVRLLGEIQDYADIYESIVYAVDGGATVLSNSWGMGEGCPAYTLPGVVKDGLYYAEEVGRDGLGSAWVMAMGNDGCDASSEGFFRVSSTIAVGASTDQDALADYSNYGARMDLVAPSGQSGRPMLLTTDISGSEGYGAYLGDADYTGQMSGTSGATPIVSGAIALMFAANPRLDIWSLREVLCETAVRVRPEEAQYDDEGRSLHYGCGRIDVAAAVAAVANTAPAAPVLLTPSGEIYLDQATLRWEPAVDPDAEALSYEVEFTPASNPEGSWSVETSETALDLRPDVLAGEGVSLRVRAVDAWGPGVWSDAVALTILSDPTPPETPTASGCQSAPGTAPGAWLFALIVGIIGLKRRELRA